MDYCLLPSNKNNLNNIVNNEVSRWYTKKEM